MKRSIQFLLTSFLVCIIWFGNFQVHAVDTSTSTGSLFINDDPSIIPYCEWDTCSLEWWLELIKKANIKGLETEAGFSQYIQGIIIYLLGFVSLIALIYVIYAWFRVLISSGDEEELKKAKKTILYVIIWILIMWFAWAITSFIVNIGSNSGASVSQWTNNISNNSNNSWIIQNWNSSTNLNYGSAARPNTIIQDAWQLGNSNYSSSNISTTWNNSWYTDITSSSYQPNTSYSSSSTNSGNTSTCRDMNEDECESFINDPFCSWDYERSICEQDIF